jgi:tagaturonate reductase
MKLSKRNLYKIKKPAPTDLTASYFNLPEKVLQFGTGVLLRGLPDYFIDKANKQGVFNGRIVVVKSTGSGGEDVFDKQDGLYTISVRGIENDRVIEENIINASISRVLSARSDWDEILKCAANGDMQVIISNTTEVGIVLDKKDNIHLSPPQSFPGKLLAFLYQRYKIFDGDITKGMVIIPTELITNNGSVLESIVLELAHLNGLETLFIDWLENHNHFCNSLVDRIVPGKPAAHLQAAIENQLGYQDDLLIIAEVYRLWAIEAADKKIAEILSFSKTDEGVILAPNIEMYRELKLRLLNGAHTFSCGLAFLAGFSTVRQSMEDKYFSAFITKLMQQEIAPAIISENLSKEVADEFSNKVLDRFRNPHINHQWLGITMQYSSKMKMRNLPAILNYYQRYQTIPPCMVLGFAAFLLFMNCYKSADGKYYGDYNGVHYLVNDDNAAWFSEKWNHINVVEAVLGDEEFWGADLLLLNGFAENVSQNLKLLIEEGPGSLLQKNHEEKVIS